MKAVSRMGGEFRKKFHRVAAWGVICAGLTLYAQQDPAHTQAKGDTPAPLRATAVLEYLGPLSKPTASRLLPIAVFDGEGYQPGGLYLAQPAPLAVEAGTEYELEQAGTPKGLYAVNAAERLNGSWIGIGRWEPLIVPAKPRLHASRTPPKVVKEVDPNRPHFAVDKSSRNEPAGQTKGGQTTPTDTSATTAKSAPPPVDPERPTLRRRPEGKKVSKESEGAGSPVTSTSDLDPDRPHLRRGVPANLEKIDQPSKLEGDPANMQQVVAISDASKSEPHAWGYTWADPGDAKKMQTAMEQIAQKLIAPPGPGPAPVSQKSTRSTAAHRRKTAAKTAPAQPLPMFTNEVFRAYELSYGGGSTLVFTAQVGDGGPATKYVALIAQPDFYGNPRVLFKQVTRGDQLDVTPRMRLVDAADTDGDKQAELIFELRSSRDRQFAIYRVAGGVAEQAFVSGSMP
ncbi:hypothetical protein [Acidipila rosea]|uniref:Uncharacterized protein n=1 Tax=Acidipila rosea TaxID=768535 RepID=A0A4R1L1S9_9BACT|nr:hypothetical protein [Acidipila rosea]TCK71915.1 hypothetical protein C7378_2537 [Acidipila rosea]